jgi:hypothetical protein
MRQGVWNTYRQVSLFLTAARCSSTGYNLRAISPLHKQVALCDPDSNSSSALLHFTATLSLLCMLCVEGTRRLLANIPSNNVGSTKYRLPHVLNRHRGKGEAFTCRLTAQSSVRRMPAYLRRASRLARLLSVAACGTLAGHALTYLLKGRTMDDGHHGYFSSLLAIAIASVLLCSVVAVLRLVTAPRNRAVREAPSSLVFCFTLAMLQVAGFAALEFFEGNAPDVFGCGIEALTALGVAAFVFFFISFAERYVAPVVTTYLRRTRHACNAIRRLPADFVQPPLWLAVCAGICRFKRPPPVFG